MAQVRDEDDDDELDDLDDSPIGIIGSAVEHVGRSLGRIFDDIEDAPLGRHGEFDPRERELDLERFGQHGRAKLFRLKPLDDELATARGRFDRFDQVRGTAAVRGREGWQFREQGGEIETLPFVGRVDPHSPGVGILEFGHERHGAA